MITKSAGDVKIGDRINGSKVVGVSEIDSDFNLNLAVMDNEGYIDVLFVPDDMRFMVDPVLEPSMPGLEAIVDPSPESSEGGAVTKLVWRSVDDTPVLSNRKYLVATKDDVFFAKFYYCDEFYVWAIPHAYGVGETNITDQVKWWTWVPIPPER